MSDRPSSPPEGSAAAPRAALVVGAGDATGGAIARRFARGGFRVVAVRRSADALQPLVQTIADAGGIAHGWACDARREDEVGALVRELLAD